MIDRILVPHVNMRIESGQKERFGKHATQRCSRHLNDMRDLHAGYCWGWAGTNGKMYPRGRKAQNKQDITKKWGALTEM